MLWNMAQVYHNGGILQESVGGAASYFIARSGAPVIQHVGKKGLYGGCGRRKHPAGTARNDCIFID